ncbi:DNA-binding response regulator [Streptomyces bacillaris]|uniref:helix-turn-helix transcriptional regulator n=1 Tax=Streptomyces bacillaris TaxID=68179 RepID=UPI00381C1750
MHESQPLHVLVHAALKNHFETPGTADSPFTSLHRRLDRIDFVEGEELAAVGGTLDLPVLLPVHSEYQTEELRALRNLQPLALLIAVTNDVSGHPTYYAIRSGANFVFNLAIEGRRQVGLVEARLRAHADARSAGATGLRTVPRRTTAPPAHPALVPDPHPSPRPTAELAPELAPEDRQLARQLCTPMTVSEIARCHYCSERSMYRRIRRLYNSLGVGNRSELKMLVSAEPAPTEELRSRAG